MILVFVGAGGSASIDPKQYPTTVEFFNRLPEDVRGNNLYSLIYDFLNSHKEGGKSIDIEEVLWTIDELQSFFENIFDVRRITGWAMNNNLLSRLSGSVLDTSSLWGYTEFFSAQCSDLKDLINTLVYDLYADCPTKNQLKDWMFLLQQLQELDPVVEIFTTNYDRVLEMAAKVSRLEIEDGRKPNDLEMVLDTTVWDTPGKPFNDHGRLTKLHGSVDWQRSSDGTIVMSSVPTENHKKQVVLYPGFKGEPKEEPFIKFHEHLRAVVTRARAAIFVGYSFRDKYINDILSGNLPKEVPKYVITKNLPSPIPSFLDPDHNSTHNDNGFTRDTVAKCLGSIILELRATAA